MPDPISYLKASIAAVFASAMIVLAFRLAMRESRHSVAAVISMLAVGVGIVTGYGVLQFSWTWPPANALNRFLMIVLPATVLVELLAAISGRGEAASVRILTNSATKGSGSLCALGLRLALYASVGRILLHDSVYLGGSGNPDAWTFAQTSCLFGGGFLGLIAVWSLLCRLSDRPAAGSITLSLAMTILCTGLATMMAGYIKGGAAAIPLAAALAGTTLASPPLVQGFGVKVETYLRATIGIGVIGLFSLLCIGHYFGQLTGLHAIVLFLTPLLCWISEIPGLRSRPAWQKSGMRFVAVTIVLAAVVSFAKQDFDRKMAPLLVGSSSPDHMKNSQRQTICSFFLICTCVLAVSSVAGAIRKLGSLCVWIAATAVFADDLISDVPFVSGFDRFGRHADIDPVTAGRLLITELSCTACHATDDAMLLAKRGPVLDGAGSRLKSDWIRSFLLSPPTSKPGTTMPAMLTGLPAEEREPAADALTAFLSSLQQPFTEIKASGLNPVPMEFWNRGHGENGRRLYHQIGCVACHAPDAEYEVTAIKPSPMDEVLQQLDADELKEMGLSSAARKVNSVPHSVLAAKYTHQSLTYFLLNPEHTRPAGRMPNFSLPAVDAADIAAWLLRDAGKSATPPTSIARSDAALIARGRQLFSDLHCTNCHSIQGLAARSFAKPLAELVSKPGFHRREADGEPKKDGQPKWIFDSAQISAIKAAMAAVSKAAKTGHTETLSFHLLQQNCYACHERNRLGGIGRHRKPYFETVGHVDIGDEGRLPTALTGVGNRLTTSWITNVLAGNGSIRPFMTIRMPVYPADVTKPLALMFASADAGTTKPPIAEKVFAQADTKTLVEAGRQLMDTGCVQCHAFKGEALPGTVGIDLEGVTQRVHPNWLHDFMKDPGSLKARTRMPTFFPNGHSQNREVLNGDVELQISAMHAYLKDLEKQPLPEKIQHARDQNYELTPTDRPIVLRTFMPVTGMHAIAVGFPQHVHFGFDAEQISLTQAWRGRFLDAEGTWFIRFAPPADPLGDTLINFPPGIAVAQLEDKSSPWPDDAASAGAKFSGYRLDKAGVPIFLYSVHGFEVTDRIEPDEANGLSRTITITPTADSNTEKQLWFRALVGKSLTRTSPQTVVSETGLSVTVTQPDNHGETRTVGNTTEWIVPITIDATTSNTVITVEYLW